MTLIIRPQIPADHAAIAELESAILGFPTTPADVAAEAEGNPAFAAVVAIRDGRLIGRAAAGFMPEHTPAGDLRCRVVVATDQRRQGIGAALWEELQPALRARRPAHLRVNGNPADPDSVTWAQRRGFAITHHLLEQSLDLTAFDPAAWAPRLDAAAAAGFRFIPFGELHTPAGEVRLHALYQEYLSHTPDAAEASYMAFAPWRAWAFETAEAWPEGWMVATGPDGDWAGFTLMQRHSPGAPGAHIYMTGISPAYRGHGLGLTLKAVSARHAKASGLTQLTTLNHAANAPILAINRHLGFVVDRGIYRLVRRWQWE